jgi:hypothetical protein
MEKKINLEDALKKAYLHELVSEERFYIIKNSMLDFCKQLLELAAENATASEYWGNDITEPQLVVNKQSILDTIKQVE